MPKIRSYDSPQQGASEQGINESGDARFAGDVARSQQQLIGAATNLAGAVYKREAQEEVSGLSASFAKAREDWTQNLNNQIRSGTVDVDKLKNDYSEYVGKLSDGVNTPEAQQFLERQSTRLRGSLIKTAAIGKAKVDGEKSVADYTSMLNSNTNTVSRNPELFQDTYDSAVEGLDAQVKTGVLDFKQASTLKAHTGSELAKGVILGTIDRNPFAAQKMLASGQYDKYLDAETQATLKNRADVEIRSQRDQADKILALKDKNPWQFLQKTGEASSVRPLSLDDTAAKSFQDRALYIDSMNKKHGLNLPFMSDQEADHLTKQFLSAQPDQATAVFNNIDNSVQDKYKSEFALQIFKKEPGLAAALMISGDAPDDSRKIIAGMNLIKSGGEGAGKAIRPPKESEVEKQFDKYIGSAVEDPATRQAARQAINAHMTKSLFDKGATDFENFSDSDFKKSAEAVLGPVVNINGNKAMSFRDKKGVFLDQDRLSDQVDSLTDKKVESIQGDVPRTMAGEPINLQKSRGRITLKSVGDGLYYVYRDSKPAWDKNKRPFVLNLKAMASAPEDTSKNYDLMPGDVAL